MKIKLIVLLFALAFIERVRAQDAYFSNTSQSLLRLNPSFAGSNGGVRNQLSYRYNNNRGFSTIYNAADVFVIPSIEENLPNTIMEALSCGIPSVGFETGGIPEMIDHKSNGYIAEYKNPEDLAKGIGWVLHESDYDTISENARKKVLENYAQEVVAKKYLEMYELIISKGIS